MLTVRLDVLHFSIIQKWYIVPHLNRHLEEEDKKIQVLKTFSIL